MVLNPTGTKIYKPRSIWLHWTIFLWIGKFCEEYLRANSMVHAFMEVPNKITVPTANLQCAWILVLMCCPQVFTELIETVRQRGTRTNSRTRITHYKPEKQRCEHEDFCNAIVASPMLRYILFWTTYQTFRSHLRPAINLYAMGSIRQSATDSATSTFTSC